MRKHLFYSVIGSLACLLVIGACGDDSATPGGTGGGGLTGVPQSTYIRIHYRLQDAGDASKWGAHFWGAGSTSPTWGSPQLFGKTDTFGAYTDVLVTDTADADSAWLGFIPVLCSGTDCKKDVETSVRFVDLTKTADNAKVAECWITQGQAVLKAPPEATGPAYKITKAKDFIDLGDGRVRMMFRVAKGSTGTVDYGASAATLDKSASWTATDDINTNGLILSNLPPGAKTYYQIKATLTDNGKDLTDTTEVLDITPIAFTTIADAADWASWAQKSVMYQLIVRTFADGGSPKVVADSKTESGIDTGKMDGVGDLVGLKSALPYLKNLGIGAVWMTPVFKAKSYHGYDTTDFYDVDSSAGTLKDFKDLTDAAHAAGIKIILDLVENHVADVNPWFVAGADPKSPDYAKYHDWFVWSDEYSNMLTDKHPWDPAEVIWACKNYMCYHKIFSGSMPELNFHNPEVRAEMKKISKYWIDLGADGFRLDASKHIDQFDDNHGIALDAHGTHVWWKEFNHFVKKEVTRPAGSAVVFLAGENRWDDPAVYGNMVPYGSDMDSQFDFPFRSIVGNLLTGKTGADVDFVAYINKLNADLAKPALGGDPNHYFERFLSNHDLDRPATQLEATGGALLPDLLKLAATMTLTVPGMPVIYYGEEVGKRGKRDKYTGMESWDHDEFIREPMSWFQDLTFTGDKTTAWNIDYLKTNAANAAPFLAAYGFSVGVTVSPNPDYPYVKFMPEKDPNSLMGSVGDPASLYAYYGKLIAIRSANPALSDPASVLALVQNTADVYEYTITNGPETLTVVLNRKASVVTVTKPAMATDLISGKAGMSWDVPAYGALILK